MSIDLHAHEEQLSIWRFELNPTSHERSHFQSLADHFLFELIFFIRLTVRIDSVTSKASTVASKATISTYQINENCIELCTEIQPIYTQVRRILDHHNFHSQGLPEIGRQRIG